MGSRARWEPDPAKGFEAVAAALRQTYTIDFDAGGLAPGRHSLAVTVDLPGVRVHAPQQVEIGR